MTVSTDYAPHSYYPGADMQPESIPFQFIDADHVVAYVVEDAPLVRGQDYVIGGNGSTGTGTITTLRAFAEDEQITIRRATPRVQEALTEPFKALPAETIGRELDRRALVEQELDGEVGRSLRVPRGEAGPVLRPMAERAGQFLVGLPGGAIGGASGTGNDAALRTDLADATKGAELIAVNPRKVYPEDSLGRYFQRTINLGATASPDDDDCADAVEAFFAEGGSGTLNVIPPGDYRFGRPISTGSIDDLTVQGSGRFQSRLLYTGNDRVSNMLTIGEMDIPMHAQLANFNVDRHPDVPAMLDGNVMELIYLRGGYSLENVSPGRNSDVPGIWNGMAFNCCNVGRWTGFEFRPLAKGYSVFGRADSDAGSDLTVGGGLILGGTIQQHVGGGFGGLYIADVVGYGGDVNLACDQNIINRGNREVIVTDAAVLDAANEAHIRVNENYPGFFLNNNAWLSGAGFFAEDGGVGVDIQKATGARILLNSVIKGSKSHAIQYNDASCNMKVRGFLGYTGKYGIVGGVQTLITPGDGIHSFVPTENIDADFAYESISGKVMTDNIRGGKTISLPVQSSGGALGDAFSNLLYRRRGCNLEMELEVDITTDGGSGQIGVTVPYVFKKLVQFSGVDNLGNALVAYAPANSAGGTTPIVITKYDGSYPGASGRTMTLTGRGEIYG